MLTDSFEWFADTRRIRTRSYGDVKSRALCLGSSTALMRKLSPTFVRAAARSVAGVMRIDIHPVDFELPGHLATLESLMSAADGRRVVTYDELLV